MLFVVLTSLWPILAFLVSWRGKVYALLLLLGAMPYCCLCNSVNSKCLGCVCVKAKRRCTNCRPSSLEICQNHAFACETSFPDWIPEVESVHRSLQRAVRLPFRRLLPNIMESTLKAHGVRINVSLRSQLRFLPRARPSCPDTQQGTPLRVTTRKLATPLGRFNTCSSVPNNRPGSEHE